jgi:hypothetical protein
MLRRLLFATAIVPLAAVLLSPIATASAATPTSCADVKARNPHAHDGAYTLAPAGPAGPHLRLVCAGLAAPVAAPRLFLILERTGDGLNFSQFTAGGTISGTNVVTSYTGLALDPTPVSTSPLTFRVNITDQTFASSTGSACCLGTEPITSMPYGVAADCNTPDSASGVANIDLTGTGFHVAAPQTFAVQGFAAMGSVIMLRPQIVDLSGGGFCGWNAPPNVSGAINQDAVNDANGGFDLQIALD